MEFNRDVSGKRILGYNLENAEEFIRQAATKLTQGEIFQLADPKSLASNMLHAAYIEKFPHTLVNDRDLMIHESHFKFLASEFANPPV